MTETGVAKTIDSKAVREWAFATGDKRSSLVVYRAVRGLIRRLLFPWLRVRSANAEILDRPGATILAPVHRSNLDSVLLASLCDRRIRALGKESLFLVPVVKYFCAALGAIPVRRGEADRDALAAALTLLERNESMIVFPEGGRQEGHDVHELFDGAAWLAGRTGARVVPIGISGTETALPQHAKTIHRSRVGVFVGEPLDPPTGIDGKRPNREQLRAFTLELGARMQAAQDAARSLASSS